MQSKLVLKKLSQDGSILEELTCLSGHVNVFRSRSPEKIEDYEKSLFDISSKEHFCLEVDHVRLDPLEGIACVGVGTFKARSGATVRQILINAGYKNQKVEELCSQYYLTSVVESSWSELSEEDFRKLELLVAVKQKTTILFIKDPFAPLSTEHRETFAKLIADAAVQDNKIVVISRLSSRPDSWVGNVAIARIDLDINRNATIGFDPRLLEQIRSGVVNQSPHKGTVLPFQQPTVKTYFKFHVIAATCILFVFVSLGSAIGGDVWSKLIHKKSDVAPQAPVVAVAPQLPQEPEPTVALALYAPDVHQSVISAFREEDELVAPSYEEPSEVVHVSAEQKRDNTLDIFKAIQETDPPAAGNSQASEESSYGGESASYQDLGETDSWEKTREEMRRRFLESLSQAE